MKILIIRFSSIGDIVLTSPVLRCVKQQVNGAEVHLLTKGQFAELVEHSPHVDQVHRLDGNFGETIGRLKTERYDHIIDLHHNARSLRVKSALGAPSSSFNKLNVQKWLRVNLKIDRLPDVHIVDRYLEAAAPLGVKNDGKGLELFIPPEEEIPLSTLPEAHRSGYIAVAIGAAHATKRLPTHKLIELVQTLNQPTVLIGGKQDQEVAAQICEKVGGSVFDATGKFSILGSASLIRQAGGVVTHDSGAMHIAAAFNKPLVSVWGNTIPAFGMHPYMPQHNDRSYLAEVEGISCRPCSKIGHEQCPRGHFRCMEQQDIHRMIDHLKA